MTIIEKNSLLMILLLIGLTICSLAISFVKQLSISQRSKINYSNFETKRKLYSLKPIVPFLVSIVIIVIYGVVLLVLFSLSNVTRIYLTAVIPFLIILTYLFINEVTISKKSRDLSYFDKKRTAIKNAISNKTLLTRILDNYKKNLELSKTEWQEITKTLEKLTTIKIPSTYGKSIVDLENLLANFEKQLSGFDNNCIAKFDKSLRLFVRNNKQVEILFDEITVPEEASVVNAFTRIKEEIEKMISDYAYEIISKHFLTNEEALLKTLDLCKKYNIDYRTWIDEIFGCIDSFKDKNIPVEYLFSEKALNESDLLKANGFGFSWVFDYDIYLYFSKNEFAEILSKLISLESEDSIRLILKHLKSERIQYFEEIVSKQEEKNKCSDLIQAYIGLFKVDYGFTDKTNMYENMAYSLSRYFKLKGGDSYQKIYAIISSEKFASNKDYISSEYAKAKNEINQMRNAYIDTIISYRNSSSFNKLFDVDRCLSLYQEYVANLNVEKIEILILLLDSIILIEEKNRSVVETVINCLKTIKKASLMYEGKLTIKQSEEIGRSILNNLLEKSNKELLTILSRIEKERMSYEKLVRM